MDLEFFTTGYRRTKKLPEELKLLAEIGYEFLLQRPHFLSKMTARELESYLRDRNDQPSGIIAPEAIESDLNQVFAAIIATQMIDLLSNWKDSSYLQRCSLLRETQREMKSKKLFPEDLSILALDREGGQEMVVIQKSVDSERVCLAFQLLFSLGADKEIRTIAIADS